MEHLYPGETWINLSTKGLNVTVPAYFTGDIVEADIHLSVQIRAKNMNVKALVSTHLKASDIFLVV